MSSTADEVTVRYSVALDRLQYAHLGLYTWEYLSHLDHDWHLVRGVWPWRWPLTTWAYLICRNATLLAVVTAVTTVGTVPCTNLVVRLSYFFPYPVLLSAASLMAARAVAIWSRAAWIIVVTIVGFVVYLATIIYATAILRVGTARLPGRIASACVAIGPDHAAGIKVTVTTNYVIDLGLLSLIFFGLWRRQDARSGGLLRMLWTQSLIFLFLAVFFTGMPLLILVWTDINGAILSIELAIGYLLVGLSVTRMTRALYNSPLPETSVNATPTSSSLAVVPVLTTIDIPESDSADLSSLVFSRPDDKTMSVSSPELCSACASSSERHASMVGSTYAYTGC